MKGTMKVMGKCEPASGKSRVFAAFTRFGAHRVTGTRPLWRQTIDASSRYRFASGKGGVSRAVFFANPR